MKSTIYQKNHISHTTEKAQFSIYKLDLSEAVKDLKKDLQSVELFSTDSHDTDSFYIEEICQKLLESIVRTLEKNPQNEICSFCSSSTFRGIMYKTFHAPAWKGIAIDLLEADSEGNLKSAKWFENVNVSYLFFYVYDRSIFAMTGGFGNHLIQKYIEKNWGLHLLPKLVQQETGLIRQLKAHKMLGNTASVSRANRKKTNFLLENDMDHIFRELSVEISRKIGEEMGISYQGEENRNTAVLFADSIMIRKQVTMEELERVIQKISEIEKRENHFSLGYFTDVKKKGGKTRELLDLLIEDLKEKKFENLQLIGEDYLDYYRNSVWYELRRADGSCYYHSEIPLTLDDIWQVFENDPKIHMTKTFLREFLKKWQICSFDENGKEKLQPVAVLDALQGFVYGDDSGVPCYLIQSKWYAMDNQYLPYMDQYFCDLYDKYEIECQRLRTNFDLSSTMETEDAYNNDLMNRKEFLVGHKALLDGYEIADVFFWDEEHIYLMCNKMHFNGMGSRDLTNQILASARYFQKCLASESRGETLRELYRKISERYQSEKKAIPIEEADFIELFRNRQICYIAGYMENYRKNTRSPYARYFTVDLNKKIQEFGYSCIAMGIR